MGPVKPIEVPLGYGHGGDVIFEDVVTGAEDVVGDVLVPVDLADVEVESALIDGRQFLAQIDRILADEAPLTQHVEAQTGDGPIGFIVEPHQLGFLARDSSQGVEDVGGYVVVEEGAQLVQDVVALASEGRVPEHVLGRVGPPRHFADVVEGLPRQRVVISRRTVVDGNVIRFGGGSVPSSGDHQVDGEFDGNQVSDQVFSDAHNPQETLASTGNQTLYQRSIINYKQKTKRTNTIIIVK